MGLIRAFSCPVGRAIRRDPWAGLFDRNANPQKTKRIAVANPSAKRKRLGCPEAPESHWVYVTAPEDEDRKMELVPYASEKAMDILCDYGYKFLIMPTKRAELHPSEPLIAWTPLSAPAG